MNAPAPDIQAASGLRVFAFFHLNLAFSSIEEERRGDVIARCYWPLLRLAERCGPIGMEISGYTLEEIAARDPDWIGRARSLIAQGRIELIGSGYSQMIGPLVPARVTAENLRLGHEVYARHSWGARPRLALVNEQAYSAGLVGLYRDAGYDALIMDWENPAANHPEWTAATQYLPAARAGRRRPRHRADLEQHHRCSSNCSVSPMATSPWKTISALFASRAGRGAARALPLRQRCGDFRFPSRPFPDRGDARRRQRVDAAGASLPCRRGGCGAWPRLQACCRFWMRRARESALSLESAACPVPVKKQRKYNLARWAVTGRDNLAINAACQRIYEGMLDREHRPGKVERQQPRAVFRPARATQKRRLERAVLSLGQRFSHPSDRETLGRLLRATCATRKQRWSSPTPAMPRRRTAMTVTERYFQIETPIVTRHAGPAARACACQPEIRRTDSIRLWAACRTAFSTTSHLPPTGTPATASSRRPANTNSRIWNGARRRSRGSRMATSWSLPGSKLPKGRSRKACVSARPRRRVEFDLAFHWDDWGKGVLAAWAFHLACPAPSIRELLTLSTTNGGGRESFPARRPGHRVMARRSRFWFRPAMALA